MKSDKISVKEKNVIKEMVDNNINDEPLFILKQNNSLVYGVLFTLVAVYIFAIFVEIIPVLKAGSFDAAWPNEKMITRMIMGYYLSWLMLMLLPYYIWLLLGSGTSYFYNDRLEFKPFAFRRKKVINYKEMHLYVYGNRGVLMAKEKLPKWSHPINRIKVQYIDALGLGRFDFHKNKIVGMPISKGLWSNPDDGPKAVQLLREKAFSIIEKQY